MSRSSTWVRGAIAGFLAATVVAIWFLLVDAVRAQPFATPAFLASLVTGTEPEIDFALVAMYTVIHYAAFLLCGIVVAWLIYRMRVRPMLLWGLVLGFLLFDVVFYAGIVLTGTNVVRALGWPEVLVGNLIAGLAMIAYLHFTAKEPGLSLRDVLRTNRTLREGLIAGALGAVAVAGWFLVIDVIIREPFFTPAALGSAIFEGARSIDQIEIAMAPVLGYTAVHVSAFLVTGLIAAAVVMEAEREAVVLLGAVLLFVTLETLLIGLLAIIASWLLDVLDGWTIIIGNLVAAAVMGGYLWHAHPQLVQHLGTRSLEEDESWADEEHATGPGRAARETGGHAG